MLRLSKNQKIILKKAYDNYVENHTREYTLRMTSVNSFMFVNTLRSFAESGIIKPISDNFYKDVVSPCEKYIFELTDDGIDLAQKSNL